MHFWPTNFQTFTYICESTVDGASCSTSLSFSRQINSLGVVVGQAEELVHRAELESVAGGASLGLVAGPAVMALGPQSGFVVFLGAGVSRAARPPEQNAHDDHDHGQGHPRHLGAGPPRP